MDCIPGRKYICNICIKEYSSRQNLWKHNNKYHMIENTQNVKNTSNQPSENVKKMSKKCQKTLTCNNCNIPFNSRQARWSHERKCILNKDSEITMLKQQLKEKDEQHKEQQKLFELQLENLKKEMIQMMNKNCKIHPKTLNKINKQLNTNNTYNDNKVINNINLIALGKEEIPDVFTRKEKLKILNTNMLALDTIVKDVHFNEKYPQFNNVLITNTQNSIGYKYNEDEKKFVAVEKSELIHEIINARMGDIVFFQEELENDIKPIVNERILKLINKMDNDKKYMENKHKDIKLIIYNNKEMIEKIRENLPLLDDVDNPLHSSNIIIV